jgi:hypothetical protein
MLTWLVVGGLGLMVYLLAKNSEDAGPKALSRTTTPTPEAGWQPSEIFTDKNGVKWNIFQWQTLAGGWGAVATGGAYNNQTFTAPTYPILTTMINAFVASLTAGKTAAAAFDDAIRAASPGSLGTSSSLTGTVEDQCVTPDAGVNVLQVQKALRGMGYSLGATGVCGPSTTVAIRHWQGENGHRENGTIDADEATMLIDQSIKGPPSLRSLHTDKKGVVWNIRWDDESFYHLGGINQLRGDPTTAPSVAYVGVFFVGQSEASVIEQIDAFVAALAAAGK